MRTAEVSRNTQETKIRVAINLDGTGKQNIDTGAPFLIICLIKSLATA